MSLLLLALASQFALQECEVYPPGPVLTSSATAVLCVRAPQVPWKGVLLPRQTFSELWRDSSELALMRPELELSGRSLTIERRRSSILVSWAEAATDRVEVESQRASTAEALVRSLEGRVSPLVWVGAGALGVAVVGVAVYVAGL